MSVSTVVSFKTIFLRAAGSLNINLLSPRLHPHESSAHHADWDLSPTDQHVTPACHSQ